MAREKRQKPEQEIEEQLPVYSDDDNYEDDLESIIADLPTEREETDEASPDGEYAQEAMDEAMTDTPEEALRKFRKERGYDEASSQEDQEIPRPRSLKKPQIEEEEGKRRFGLFGRKKKKKREEDDDLPVSGMGRLVSRLARSLRKIVKFFISLILVVTLMSIGVSKFQDIAVLKIPEEVIARVVTPVQSAFSWFTETFAGYFRQVKLLSTLEEAYENLREENQRLVYKAMLAEEYEIQLSQYEDIYDEINANRAMDPVTATVIGKYDGNYFSTFTINKGSRDGLGQFMAVTISGALIGYTEDVRETESTVRTIIDSESSIAGLIQSSRDQGIVKGTLGVDGTALCRMYYLPDDNLPRPGDTVVTSGVGMSFPKGIPIGTVRESTRGMDANKQFVVVEPTADFQHIEYVIVYRYQPRAEAIQGRENASAYIEYVPLETARPYPTLQLGSSAYFLPTATPAPTPVYQSYATLHPGGTPEPDDLETTPVPVRVTPTPTARPTPTPEDTSPVFEYQRPFSGPTPTPTPTPTPSPTPFITFTPADLTWEDD